jgi:hypothetical protein
MAKAALREPAPRVTLVLSLTVENVDSWVILSPVSGRCSDLRLSAVDTVVDGGHLLGRTGFLNFV